MGRPGFFPRLKPLNAVYQAGVRFGRMDTDESTTRLLTSHSRLSKSLSISDGWFAALEGERAGESDD